MHERGLAGGAEALGARVQAPAGAVDELGGEMAVVVGRIGHAPEAGIAASTGTCARAIRRPGSTRNKKQIPLKRMPDIEVPTT